MDNGGSNEWTSRKNCPLSHTFILMPVKARTNCSSKIYFLTNWYPSFAMICNEDKSERGKCFSTNSISGIPTMCSDMTRWKWVMSLFIYGILTFQNFASTTATPEQYTKIIQFVPLSFFYNPVACSVTICKPDSIRSHSDHGSTPDKQSGPMEGNTWATATTASGACRPNYQTGSDRTPWRSGPSN